MPKTKKILITTQSTEIFIVRTASNEKVTVCPECGGPIAKRQPDMEVGKVIKHRPSITKGPEQK